MYHDGGTESDIDLAAKQARAMAARLVGLIASRGDDLRAELLAHGALDGLLTALGAMDAVASAGGPLPVRRCLQTWR